MNHRINFLKQHISHRLNFSYLYPYIKKIVMKFKPHFPWNIKNHLKMISFYSQFINKGDLCFDIGANIGEYTMTFLRLRNKVICVEPQLICLRKLYELFRKNKNVIIVGKAVGDKEGISELSICENESGISTLSNKWKIKGRFSKNHKWTKTQKVKITTLDKLISTYGFPKFCKIDVEGFELECLKGLSKKIPYICFEFTKEFINDAMKCMGHLQSLGNVKFNYVTKEEFRFRLFKWIYSEQLYDVINSIPDDLLWGDIYARFI